MDNLLHTERELSSWTMLAQEHTAYIIAKVRPPGSSVAKYRIIAACVHNWCYGTLPLRAAHRLLCSLRQPQNAEVIREELRSIDGKYNRGGREPRMPAAACSFITALLADSWDFGLAPDHIFLAPTVLQGSMLEADMHTWVNEMYYGDSSATVIDVTNPEDPAYCFIPFKGLHKPEDARRYIRRYYWFPGDALPDIMSTYFWVFALPTEPDNAEERDLALGRYENIFLPLISQFQDARLLDDSTILESWFLEPHEITKEDWELDDDDELGGNEDKDTKDNKDEDTRGDEDADAGEEMKTGDDEGEKNGDAAEHYESRGAAVTSIPSLVDITLRKALEQAITSGETRGLEDMPWLSEKMNIVEEILHTVSPFPDAALPFLQWLTNAQKYWGTSLDLAGFPLTGFQILSIATALPEVRSLNVSRNSALGIMHLREVLAGLPSLARLVLIDCPSLEADELVHLVADRPELFRHIQSIIHPAFTDYSKSFIWAGTPARMVVKAYKPQSETARGVSFPLLMPGVLVQGLIDLLTLHEDMTGTMGMYGWRALEVAFASVPRAPGTPWTERTLAIVPFRFPRAPSHTSECWMLYVSTAAFPPDSRDDQGYAFLQYQPIRSDGRERTVRRRDFLLHDLRSFLRTTEQQGYPSVPEDLVCALEAGIKKHKLPVYTRAQILEAE